jgi:uncharacterized protein (DUF2147 family)
MVLLSALIALTFASQTAARALDVSGSWLTNRRDAMVTFEDCGDGSPCRRIVWLLPSHGAGLDHRNLNPKLRDRNVMGSRIAWGFSRNQEGWTRGRLYNPETGQTFDAAISRHPDGRLKVQGCLGPACLTRYWTRQSSPPQVRKGRNDE